MAGAMETSDRGCTMNWNPQWQAQLAAPVFNLENNRPPQGQKIIRQRRSGISGVSRNRLVFGRPLLNSGRRCDRKPGRAVSGHPWRVAGVKYSYRCR